jgi:anti-sigma regulatory factor (Ser/Thr protein kinase)
MAGPRVGRHGFEHDALLYDDAGAVAEQLATTIVDDLHDGQSVLVCVREPVAKHLAGAIPAHDRLAIVDADDRYSRPVDALHVLWRFTREQVDAGAARVHSIGELAFTGGPVDEDWYWYEAACNHVLAELPITGTCLYSRRSCPDRALAMSHATHEVVLPHAPAPANGAAVAPTALAPPVVPERAPDVELASATESRSVRAVLCDADGIDDDVTMRAGLVLSELVTNAVKHGGGSADVRMWFDAGAVVCRVVDRGPGIVDPFATMRLPWLQEHGVGLWLSNVEATRLVLTDAPEGGTVATALIAPR